MAYSEMSWAFFRALIEYEYADYGDCDAAYCMGSEL